MKKVINKRIGKNRVCFFFKYAPRLLACLLINIVSFQSFAQTSVSTHQQVQEGAKAYLSKAIDNVHGDDDIHINIVPIDERIKIPDCASGFRYHADGNTLTQNYISVRVSCNNNDWYVFTNARVSRTRPVIVTAGTISPGTVLTSQNLAVANVDVNLLRHTSFTEVKTLIGARMKRRVREGQPIQSNMLCFVCKGDRITISAQAGSMQVKTSGIAQQDGVIGDSIEVVNASSKKSVIAEVANTQEVVVHL